MIYEGKEYRFKVGDKVEINAGRLQEEKGVIYQIWPHGSVTVDFGRFIAVLPPYYLELIEEAPVKFKSGDRVRLTDFELNGQINFGNFNGYVDGEKFDGDYKVKFDDGAFGFFPPSSLELIKSYTIFQLKACEDFKKMIDELKAIVPLSNDVGVSPTNAVPKKEHELINQTSKNIKQTDTVNSPSLSENINDLFTEIKDIIVAKNENYGDSFSKQYQKYGMISVEMRLNDKFMRLEQLVAGEKDKVGESIEDTLKDIIGYATLTLIEL